MCIYRDSSADLLGMSNNLYHQAWPIRWTCQIFQRIFFSFCEVKPWTVQAMFWNTQTVAELRYNAHTFHVEEIPYYTVLPQIFKLFILVVTPRTMGNCSNFPRSEKIRWDSRKNSLFITASRRSQHVIKQPSHVRLHVFWMYLVCCDLSKHVVCRRCVNRLRFWFDIKIRNWKKWRQNMFGFESDSHSARSFVLLLFLN